MSNFMFIESAKQSLKNVSANLKSGNKEFTSLSSVLRDMQRKQYLKAGYAAVLEALGLPTDGSVTPAMIRERLQPEQLVEVTTGKGKDKETKQEIGLWSWVQQKDENGEKVVDKDGKPVVVAVCHKVTAWTPNKLFKVVAQSNALKAQK